MEFQGNLKLAAFVAIILGILIIYSTMIEPNTLNITNNSFDLFGRSDAAKSDASNGSQAFETTPIRIVFISDMHVKNKDSPDSLERIVSLVNAQNPDLIFIGGDSVDGGPDDWTALTLLGKLSARYGTYAIMGNHDYMDWKCANPASIRYGENVVQTLESINITVLRNENRIIEIKGHRFALVGVDDLWACKQNYPKSIAGLDQTMPRIILIHQQEGLQGIDLDEGPKTLALAGHTHCGGVRLPIVGSVPKMFGFVGDIAGRGTIGQNTDVYVTCGTSKGVVIPIRFMAPPEISVIEVR